MTEPTLPNDPLWPRASAWIVPAEKLDSSARAELAIVGIPAHLTSITPTGAHGTPDAIRDALQRYSTYAAGRGTDISRVLAVDLGDIASPDGPDGESRVQARIGEIADRQELLIALGGDNSITYSVMRGLFSDSLAGAGLVTIDAHHDLRDGATNGSPVRRLVEAGLPGQNIVQIGIADFSNSAAYSARAADLGITVIHREELRHRPLDQLVAYALGRAGLGDRPVYVDIDVDVCDRAVVPACPSAAPGGISSDELRQIAFLVGRDPRVRAIDITEIDATTDAHNGCTVRLGALLVLEAAAGLASRLAGQV